MATELAVRFLTVGAFAENSYVVGCPASGRAVLIDPGGEVPALLEVARELGLEIDAIWLTHAHLDHVLGLREAAAATGAPIWLHPEDRMLYDAAPQQGEAFGFPVEPLPEVDESFASGQRLQLGEHTVEVLFVPGHSPGHVAFWFPEAQTVVAGDVLFAGSIGRMDLPGGDEATMKQTLEQVILTLSDELNLYPGHGPATTLGHEREHNPYLNGMMRW